MISPTRLDKIRATITFIIQVLIITCTITLVVWYLYQFQVIKDAFTSIHSQLTIISRLHLTAFLVLLIGLALLYKQKLDTFLKNAKVTVYYKLLAVGVGGIWFTISQINIANPEFLLFLFFTFVLTLIIGSLGLLAWQSILKQEEPEPLYLTDSTDLQDEPLLVNQQKVQEALQNIVIAGSPKSIALTGEWGSGKSTIMRQVQNGVNNVVWVNFKPWSYTNENAMVAGFYESILSSLNEQTRYTATNLQILKKPIESLVGQKQIAGFAGAVLNYIQFRLNVKTPEERINAIINKTGAKIVIVVDDIERNYKAELINRTLQLAHYAKQLDSTQIIMLFEREALVQTRPKSATSAQEYLEKFFELEFKLSIPTPEELEPYFIRLIKKHLRVEVDSLPNELLTDIGTYRSAIRLLNELIYQQKNMDTLSLDSSQYFQRSIEFTDILFISHIKLRYPRLYADIQQHRGLYTQPGDYERLDFGSHNPINPSEKAKSHLQTLYEKMELTGEEAVRVEALLTKYFPGLSVKLGKTYSNTSSLELENRSRIGSRTILDWYFGLAGALDSQLDYEEAAEEVLEAINKPGNTDEDIITKFGSFLVYLSEFKDSNEAITILFRQIPKQRAFKRTPQTILKCAFIAFMNQPTGVANRERMEFLSAIYSLIRTEIQDLTDHQKQAFLKDVISPYHVSRHLNNALLAAYVINFNFSSAAKYFKNVASDEYINDLEKRVLRTLAKNYPPANLFTQGLNASQAVYALESWFILEQKHLQYTRKKLSSRAQLKYLTTRYPSSFLELFKDFEDKLPILVSLNRTNEELLTTYLPYIKKSPALSTEDKKIIRELEETISRHSP